MRGRNKTANDTPGVFLETEIHNLGAFQAESEKFNIDCKRFHSLSKIGKGSYGLVASALDLNTGKRVAIKKVGAMEAKLMALRTLREIRILRFLDHENIIPINEIASYQLYSEVYIVQPLIEHDLHNAMLKRNFDDQATSYITYQLFRGLKYLHSALIIHRDLKPSNILIDSFCNIKICDFGLARVFNDADEEDNLGMTEYVATRWYRAPEIMIAARNYDKSVDVWAIGCVLAELMSHNNQRVLFPGQNYLKMIEMMVELLGTPTDNELSYVVNPKAREYVKSLKQSVRVNWARKFPTCSLESTDLLDKILTMSPMTRITVEKALKHPFVRMFPQVPDYKFDTPLLFEENFDQLSTDQIKYLIAKEAELINSKF